MSDSETVDTSLDDFEKKFFQVETPAPVEEVSETPSATEQVEESAEETEVVEAEVEAETIEEDTLADEEEDEEVEEAEAKPEPKKRKPARERINELTREKRELERRLLALEEAARKPVSEEKPEPKTAAPAETNAPAPDDVDEKGEALYPLGEFDPRYIQALVKHVNEVERAEFAQKQAEEAKRTEAEKAEQELTNAWTEKVQTSLERLPDLPEKVVDLEANFRSLDPEYGNFLASTIMSLDNGPDVLNYLADNLEEAQRIAAAGPTRAIVALGRLDARFEPKEEKSAEVDKGNKVKLSSAPAPAPKNKGVGVAKPIDLSDLETFEKEFFK